MPLAFWYRQWVLVSSNSPLLVAAAYVSVQFVLTLKRLLNSKPWVCASGPLAVPLIGKPFSTSWLR